MLNALTRLARISLPDHISPTLEVRGVSFHSGRVRTGDVFFALPGEQEHGIAYADDALARGAVVVVSDKPHPRGLQVDDPAALLLGLGRHARAQLSGPVIGVTGSAGKTSTKAMLSAALDARVSPGNMNTPLALAKVLIESWLAGETGADDRLVLEMGIDDAGEMDVLVSLVEPSHAVLTLIAESHLKGLGDLAGVAREKLKLVTAAKRAWVSEDANDFLSPTLRERVTVYGLGDDADVRGRVVEVDDFAAQRVEVEGTTVRVSYPGVAMAKNAVGAWAVATGLGVDPETAAARLSGVGLEPGRLQRHTLGNLTLLDDSYNSNPASAKLALDVLRTLPKPHTAILGDMLELGARSEQRHAELGELTRRLDRVIAIGPEAAAIVRGNPQARYFETVEAALTTLATETMHGSVLVKASRGMRFERIVKVLKETEVVS